MKGARFVLAALLLAVCAGAVHAKVRSQIFHLPLSSELLRRRNLI